MVLFHSIHKNRVMLQTYRFVKLSICASSRNHNLKNQQFFVVTTHVHIGHRFIIHILIFRKEKQFVGYTISEIPNEESNKKVVQN
jgi:hypothetical protein